MNQILTGVFAKVQSAGQQCAQYVKAHPMVSLLTITGALVGIAISCVIPPAAPVILVGAGLSFGIGKGLEKLNKRPVNSANSSTVVSVNRLSRSNSTLSLSRASSLGYVADASEPPSEETSPQHTTAVNSRFAIADDSLSNFFSGLKAWKNAGTEGENRAEAAKRILLARIENETSLDLQRLGLKSLPPEVGQLTQLQALDLFNNQLTNLPPTIGQLTQLKTLLLAHNRLSSLSPEIGQLTQLQALDLFSNQLTNLPPTIGQLTQLSYLGLSSNELTSLPTTIGQLTQLQTLRLNRNQLTVLPPDIGLLTQLKTLLLAHNRLSSLSPEIGQLTQLQHLNLSENQLSSLPPEIGQLTQLQRLRLSENQLSSLPSEIGQLTQLQSLYLRGNELTSLPSEIGQLTQLQRLGLMENRALTQLPESLSSLQNLSDLDLGWCSNLSTLPTGFERLPAGAEVNTTGTGLSPNALEALGRAIEQERVSSNGRRGPRIRVSLPAAVTRPVQSLDREIMLWFEESNQSPQFTPAVLEERLSQLPTEEIILTAEEALNDLSVSLPKNQSEALATLLMSLRKTGHYTRAPSDMQQRVCNLLNGMMEHEDVLQTAGMMAFEGIQTCDDRTALSMLIMELDLVQHQAVQTAIKAQPAPNSPERRVMFLSLLKLGQGVFKESKLMDIAHKQAKEATGIVDETEIVLKYITHLSQALDLPVKWSNMLYEICANIVTTEHINKAKTDLKDVATLDNSEFLSFLSTWQPLRSLLETFEPEALAQIRAGIQQLEATRSRTQEALEDEMERAITTHGEQSPEALNLEAAMNTNAKMVEEQTPALWRKAVEQVIRE